MFCNKEEKVYDWLIKCNLCYAPVVMEIPDTAKSGFEPISFVLIYMFAPQSSVLFVEGERACDFNFFFFYFIFI